MFTGSIYHFKLPIKKIIICLDFSPLNSANSGLFSEVTLRIGMSRTAMNLQKQSSISQFPQNCFKCEKVSSFAMGNILPFVPVSLYILVTWFFGRSYQSQLSCLFVFNNKFAYWLISFHVTWKRNLKNSSRCAFIIKINKHDSWLVTSYQKPNDQNM